MHISRLPFYSCCRINELDTNDLRDVLLCRVVSCCVWQLPVLLFSACLIINHDWAICFIVLAEQQKGLRLCRPCTRALTVDSVCLILNVCQVVGCFGLLNDTINCVRYIAPSGGRTEENEGGDVPVLAILENYKNLGNFSQQECPRSTTTTSKTLNAGSCSSAGRNIVIK